MPTRVLHSMLIGGHHPHADAAMHTENRLLLAGINSSTDRTEISRIAASQKACSLLSGV